MAPKIPTAELPRLDAAPVYGWALVELDPADDDELPLDEPLEEPEDPEDEPDEPEPLPEEEDPVEAALPDEPVPLVPLV